MSGPIKGYGNVAYVGLKHGLFCLGAAGSYASAFCKWSYEFTLVVAITVIVLVEKMLPYEKLSSRFLGILLVGWGAYAYLFSYMTVNPLNLHWEIVVLRIAIAMYFAIVLCLWEERFRIHQMVNAFHGGELYRRRIRRRKVVQFNPIKRESKGIMDLSGLNCYSFRGSWPLGSGGWTAGLWLMKKHLMMQLMLLQLFFRPSGWANRFRHMIANLE